MPIETSTTPRHVLTVSQENWDLTYEENNWDLTLTYTEGNSITITNALVNSAIEDNPAATGASLGLGTAAYTSSSAYATASHTHGNITTDGKIGLNTTANLVVITTTGGALTTASRSGIDTRTSFPNTDVTNATTTGAADQLLRLNAGGNAVANVFIATEGVEAGEEGGDSGYLRIINASGDLVTINNANASNAEVSFPTGSGTLALTSSADGSLSTADISDFVDHSADITISNITTSTATVSTLLTANHIHGNIAGTVYTHVRTGEAVNKGDPVYIDGFHSGYPRVMKADASDSSKMPAIGVMDADYAANTNGANAIIVGTISNVDTDGFGVNTPIYVADGGGYSVSAGTIPQQIGITERDNQNNGAFIVTNSKVLTTADIANLVNGTASLSVAAVVASDYISTVGNNAAISTSGSTASIYTLGESAYINTSGENASVYTGGQFAYIYTTGLNASMFTSGDNASIYTSGANAGIYTNGLDAPIYTMGGNAHISTQSATAYIETRSTFRLFDGTYATTLSHTPTADNAIAFQDGSGTVAFTSDLPTLGTNVATFLATPTSANLAAAVTNETGSGSLVFAELPTIKPSQQTLTNIVTRGTEYGSPSVCLFEDFFGITGLGVNWNSSGTAGRGSIAQGSVGQRGRNLGITRILTGTTVNDTRFTTLFVGQHQDLVGTIWRADFAIPTLSNIQFSIGGGISGGSVFRYSLGYDTSVSTTDWLLFVNNYAPVVLSGLGIPAPQTGNFASGTRYRMTLSMTSFTTGYLKLQSAPWNTAVWTTLYDGSLSHTSWNNSQWGSLSPFLFVQTLDTVAKSLECDWFAVDYPWIQR
jgi:hypothetical protein